jgi:phosphopantothenoylcysteine decarboxylase / phosphopantothenate---cysteine ligase
MKDTSVQIKSQLLKGKRIALCVTGGIAACETVKLARELRRYSADVVVYMTEGAKQFITLLSLEWAAQNKVVSELSSSAEHIVDADLVLVAPATLNTINKIAQGFADSTVTTTVASAWGQGLPIVIVPTMHQSLSSHPVYQESIARLKKEKNFTFIEPKAEEGKDKFPKIETIVSEVCHFVIQSAKREESQGLVGKNILITAGPTQGPIDPVRFISNFSTGSLGVELAKKIYENGANPTLIYGPGQAKPHAFYPVVNVKTPQEMLDAVETEVTYKKYDAAIFAAAVLDHVPTQVVNKKLPSQAELKVDFKKTPKIIREIDLFTRKKCESRV